MKWCGGYFGYLRKNSLENMNRHDPPKAINRQQNPRRNVNCSNPLRALYFGDFVVFIFVIFNTSNKQSYAET